MPLFALLFNIFPLPIRTDRTLRAVPYVTYSLLFLNLCVHLFNLRLSNYEFHLFELQWGFVASKPSLLTVFTSTFIHVDLLYHLLPNMLLLWVVGTVLESNIGSITFLLLYFASAMCAILIYTLIGHTFLSAFLDFPLVGASGAISGITGLTAMRFSRLRALTFAIVPILGFPVPFPLPFWMPLSAFALYFAARELYMGLLNVYTHQSDIAAHWAHIGGLMLGVIAGVLMQVVQEDKRESVLEDSVRQRRHHRPRAPAPGSAAVVARNAE